jgi:hypothetical protein
MVGLVSKPKRRAKTQRGPQQKQPLATSGYAAPGGDVRTAEPGAEQSWIAKPPRKNLPLLVVSALLLAVWLAFLAWLAFSVRSQRDNGKAADESSVVGRAFLPVAHLP